MKEIKRNSLQAWILAARPKTLTGAVTPVLIGTALAAMDGHFEWLPALICCVFASLMQIAANFINDLFDFLKGTDREDRLGPERACAQGWISLQAMKTGIIVTVTLACLIGCTLLFYAGWELIIVGVLCVLFAFLYTTGCAGKRQPTRGWLFRDMPRKSAKGRLCRSIFARSSG